MWLVAGGKMKEGGRREREEGRRKEGRRGRAGRMEGGKEREEEIMLDYGGRMLSMSEEEDIEGNKKIIMRKE